MTATEEIFKSDLYYKYFKAMQTGKFKQTQEKYAGMLEEFEFEINKMPTFSFINGVFEDYNAELELLGFRVGLLFACNLMSEAKELSGVWGDGN